MKSFVVLGQNSIYGFIQKNLLLSTPTMLLLALSSSVVAQRKKGDLLVHSSTEKSLFFLKGCPVVRGNN